MPVRVMAQEIIGQSQQGMLRPFLIRADDGHTYFVKGLARAGGASLVSELIAAELGKGLGLPIAPWCLMEIPEGMIGFSVHPNIRDLEGGPAFASRQVSNASELLWTAVNSIPSELQKMLLLFDWWILNADRNLGERAGNVNLLLDSSGQLVVIDHNCAFDVSVTLQELQEYHVFRSQVGKLQNDLLARVDYLQLMDAALADWERIVSLIPDEWLYRDADQIDETEPTLKLRLQILERYKEEPFWRQL